MKTLTKGNPLKLIIIFAIPIFMGRLFQQFYTIVDTRIVGETLGETALAAVGCTSTVSDMMISFINGSSSGFAIIVSTFFGANDKKGVKKAAAMTFSMGIIFAIIMTVLCLLFLNPLLSFLNVSPELIDNAKSYIGVMLGGLIITSLYNTCAAVLRAIGDSVTPLLFLIFSSFLNIFLDYAFVLGLKRGVAGVAMATVIAQAISFVLCFVYMWKKYPLLHFGIKDMHIDRSYALKMLKPGMSMGLMFSLVYFGTVALQTTINTFGTLTIVAHTAARKMTSLYMLPQAVLSQALATFVGQNYGAKEYKRIKVGILQTLILSSGWSLVVILISYTIVPTLLSLLIASTDETIIKTATLYLKVDSLFYAVCGAIGILRNALQGVGDSVTPIVSSLIELIGKVIIAFTLARAIGYFGIIIAEPIVWILMVIPLVIQVWRFIKNI